MRGGDFLAALSLLAISEGALAQSVAVSCDPQLQWIAVWAIEEGVAELQPASRVTEVINLDKLLRYRRVRMPDGETRDLRDGARSVYRRCGPYGLQFSVFWANDDGLGHMGAQVVPKIRVKRENSAVLEWTVLDECYASYGLDCSTFGRKVVIQWGREERVSIMRTTDSQ
jgi:hypothetical protein